MVYMPGAHLRRVVPQTIGILPVTHLSTPRRATPRTAPRWIGIRLNIPTLATPRLPPLVHLSIHQVVTLPTGIPQVIPTAGATPLSQRQVHPAIHLADLLPRLRRMLRR